MGYLLSSYIRNTLGHLPNMCLFNGHFGVKSVPDPYRIHLKADSHTNNCGAQGLPVSMENLRNSLERTNLLDSEKGNPSEGNQ